MPAPTGTYNDGGIKFVRQTITLLDTSGASETYVVKSGSLETPIKRVVRENENGVEDAQAFMTQIKTGSLTLQFVAEADKPPKPLQAAQVVDTTGAAVDIILAKVSQTFGAGEEASVTCEIFEKKGS